MVRVIPRPGAVVIEGPDTLCAGEELHLHVSGPDTVGYVWHTPQGTVQGDQLHLPEVSEANGGLYISAATYQGCSGEADEHLLVVHVPQPPPIAAEHRLCDGGAIAFQVPQGYSDILWSTGATAAGISVVAGGDFLVTANDPNGCPVAASFTVEVDDCELVVPNVFTPNGDGTNDVWAPTGGFIQADVRIRNRWGGLVHEGDMVRQPWRGRHHRSGEPCADGVYFYEIAISRSDGSMRTLTGYLQLLY